VKINRGRVAGLPSRQREETFSGPVWSEPLLSAVEGVVINSVFFAPRTRTNWHVHERGQILLVTGGSGLVITETGAGGTIGTGDVVWIEPGENHWHGAGPDTYLTHIAISLGATDWAQGVVDADYESAWGVERGA
jgi:quercetin dioxygenase-like cupin family protein